MLPNPCTKLFCLCDQLIPGHVFEIFIHPQSPVLCADGVSFAVDWSGLCPSRLFERGSDACLFMSFSETGSRRPASAAAATTDVKDGKRTSRIQRRATG